MRNSGVRFVLKLAAVFVIYFVTARIGLSIDAVSGFATLVWPPTGIALATILILGRQYWPGIALAAFLVNLATGATPMAAVGIAIGNTLEAIVGAYLLKNVFRIDIALERLRDVLGLIFAAAVVSTLISATIGVISLWMAGIVPLSAYANTWLAWWVGDMLGVLVAAPFLLIWSRRPWRGMRPWRIVEAVLLLIVLAITSIAVFRGYPAVGIQPFALVYMIFPLLMWVALRFGQLGSATAMLLVAGIAIWTAVNVYTTGNVMLSYRLLLLQTFIGITATTFMTFAAIVTERERSLHRQQQLETRTQFLTKQRALLRSISQAKDEFIALASHQLRTPATSVKQYLAIMLDNLTGKLSDRQRHMLTVAYDSNERQLQILEDLLKVARIDMGKLTLKKTDTDVVKLVAKILEAMSPMFEAKNQQVIFTHTKPRMMCNCDKERLHMVLENLIHNASKYTLPGKKVEIKLEQAGKNLVIGLHDEGVGIAKRDLAKLFKKFSRIDNPLSITAGGSGLGLYWAKKVIDLHGGTIRVTSKLHEGSTFTVELPGRT
jgi:signal transduction histidine kinase